MSSFARTSGARTTGLIVGLLVMLVTAGCFRGSLDEEQLNVISENIPTATDTPVTPSLTPQPTVTVTPSLTPTETPRRAPTLTPTIISARAQAADADALDELVAERQRTTPTNTPTATPSLTPTSTPTPTANVVAVGTAVAQANQPDPFQQTATAFVAGVTQTAAFSQTLTAIAQGIGQPTATPTLTPTLTPTFPSAAGGTGGTTTTGGNNQFSGNFNRPGQNCYYVVQPGDRLFRVSLTYLVPVATIAADSGISDWDLIFPGQVLTIRGCGTRPGVLPPLQSPPTPTPEPGNVPVNNPTNPGICDQYLVQQGDTLFSIAQAYNTTVDAIAFQNGIINPNIIDFNITLQIPCPTTS